MSTPKITVSETRQTSPEEAQLVRLFEQMENDSLNNLEAGARQIIQLVSSLFGVMLGTLALGDEKFAAALQTPLVAWLASLVLFAWLIALLAALGVVIPGEWLSRRASLDDMRSSYRQLLQQKSNWLYRAVVAFGIGILLFVIMVGCLLFLR